MFSYIRFAFLRSLRRDEKDLVCGGVSIAIILDLKKAAVTVASEDPVQGPAKLFCKSKMSFCLVS